MAAKKTTNAIAQLDAICDEFERVVIECRQTGRKPGNIDQWLRRVEPELRPWLRRELIALYRELTGKSASRPGIPADDVPIGVDPAIWRAIKGNRTFRALSLDAKESLAKGIHPQTFSAGATLLKSGHRTRGCT